LKLEREDLHLLAVNNATRAFQRTGLFPYNPFAEAWTEAIETIGQGQKPHAGTHYEIFVNENIPNLTESESVVLCDGLNLEDSDLRGFHDLEVAKIRGMHILKHWREDILKAVSKGEQYEAYSSILIPSPKMDSEIMAMQLIHFEKIDSKSLCPVSVEKKTKEEKAAEITCRIVLSTKNAEPVFVTYLPPSHAEFSDDNSEMSKTSNGTAVKEGANSWHVSLDNNTSMTVTNNDLMDPSKFYVEQRYLSIDGDESKKKNKV